MRGFCKIKFIGLYSLILLNMIAEPATANWFARGRLVNLSFQDVLGAGLQASVNQVLFNKKFSTDFLPGLTVGFGFMSGQAVSQSLGVQANPTVVSGFTIPIEYSWSISKVVFLNIGYNSMHMIYRPSAQTSETSLNPSFLMVTGQSYLTKAFFMELSVGLNTQFPGGSYQGLGFGVLLN